MDFKKSYRQAGFTLMEVMVGAVLVSVLGLAIISQTNLITTSKREADQNAIINGLNDKLIVELSKRSTCTLAANFGGKAMPTSGTPVNITNVVNSEGAVIVASNAQYGRKVSGGSLAASDVNSVQTGQIQLKYSANANEVLLSVPFQRRKGLGAITWRSSTTIEIPLTVERNGATIASCYNDITNSITSAIRLSCVGNSSRFLLRPDPATYPSYAAFSAYGVCEHKVQTTSCPTGQYIKRIELSGTNGLIYSCASITNACPANQIITGFNGDGSVICNYPFVNCAAGQMMVMGTGGKYICLTTNNPGGTGCTGLYAVKRFNSDGTVTCAQYYPPRTCSGMVRSIAPDGTTTCDAYVTAVVCPTGQYVSTVTNGVPTCAKYYEYPQSCPAGQGMTGIDANGVITCQDLTRRLICNGTWSPGGRNYNDCSASGGTLLKYSATLNICRFNASSCPGGYTQCSAWRYTQDTSCTDTNSACSYSVQTRYAYGSNVFTDPGNIGTTNCYYWARNSGPWVRSCTGYIQPATTTPILQVGCY